MGVHVRVREVGVEGEGSGGRSAISKRTQNGGKHGVGGWGVELQCHPKFTETLIEQLGHKKSTP